MGFMGPSMGVVGGRRGSSENVPFLESLRMALAHYKYVPLLLPAPRPPPYSASMHYCTTPTESQNLGGPAAKSPACVVGLVKFLS